MDASGSPFMRMLQPIPTTDQPISTYAPRIA
jgi:hypothetical protein